MFGVELFDVFTKKLGHIYVDFTADNLNPYPCNKRLPRYYKQTPYLVNYIQLAR